MGATNRIQRCGFGLALASAAMAAGAADGLSKAPSGGDSTQARHEGGGPFGLRLNLPGAAGSPRAALLGDYSLGDFGFTLPHAGGRFRATSGVLLGLKNPAASGPLWLGLEASTLSAPYIGVGYTGWLTKSGLSFSADVGVTADYPGGTWKLGRAVLGNQGSDAALRELRLQPRLQLGMQYRY